MHGRIEPRPVLGYALAATAAAMWALNGSLARFLLDDGVSAPHLSQLRATLSFLLLAGFLALRAPASLRIDRAEVGHMAWFGIAGLAAVHAAYFFAIERLQIGVALTVQYLGPMLILVWLAIAHRRRLARTLWGAVGLSVAGCFLVVEAYDARSLDGAGLLAAGLAAVTFAIYMVAAERAGRRYAAPTTLAWGFGFASLFWLVVRPPWTFPAAVFADAPVNVLLVLAVVIVGTLVPFLLMLTALRHVPAPRAGVVATLEPVLAALIAWPVHGEALSVTQLAGGMLVIAAVGWVQTHPPDLEHESSPPSRTLRRRRGVSSDSTPPPISGARFRLPKRQTVREDGTQSHGAP